MIAATRLWLDAERKNPATASETIARPASAIGGIDDGGRGMRVPIDAMADEVWMVILNELGVPAVGVTVGGVTAQVLWDGTSFGHVTATCSPL